MCCFPDGLQLYLRAISSRSCPLAQSYSLFLTSTALQHHVVQSRELNTVAHASIVKALRMALKVCEEVMPRGLTRALVKDLKEHILVVEFGECWA